RTSPWVSRRFSTRLMLGRRPPTSSARTLWRRWTTPWSARRRRTRAIWASSPPASSSTSRAWALAIRDDTDSIHRQASCGRRASSRWSIRESIDRIRLSSRVTASNDSVIRRNVAHHVTRPEDLHHDRPAVEGAGQLDCTAADDVNPAGRLARPEEEPAGVVLVLPEFGRQPGHVLRGERREVGPPDPTQMTGDPGGLLPRIFLHIQPNQPHCRKYSPGRALHNRRNLCSGDGVKSDFTAVTTRRRRGDIGSKLLKNNIVRMKTFCDTSPCRYWDSATAEPDIKILTTAARSQTPPMGIHSDTWCKRAWSDCPG